MKTTEIYKGINAKMENRIDNSNLKYLSRSTKLGKNLVELVGLPYLIHQAVLIDLPTDGRM